MPPTSRFQSPMDGRSISFLSRLPSFFWTANNRSSHLWASFTSCTSRFNSSAYRRSFNRMDIPTHLPSHYHPSAQPAVTPWAAPYTRQ